MIDLEPGKAYRRNYLRAAVTRLPTFLGGSQPLTTLMILTPTYQLPNIGPSGLETIASRFLPNHLDSGQVYDLDSSVRSLGRLRQLICTPFRCTLVNFDWPRWLVGEKIDAMRILEVKDLRGG